MAVRSRKGGMLPLVAGFTVVLALIGIAFFVLTRILGGGRELQHATDSGNLNVAKQCLKRPGITLTDTDEVNNFGGCVDATTGQVNLLTYNRLVGQAVLVALNAQEQGTASATGNAQTVLSLVQGPDGIGKRLHEKLATPSESKSFFETLANQHLMRMLGGPTITAIDTQVNLSFMARGKASNLYIASATVPPGTTFPSANIITKDIGGGSRNYLKGYEPLSVGGLTVWGVPVRPGEQPHLVSLKDFNDLDDPVLANDEDKSRLPGNSFRSGGSSNETQSARNIELNSCAIVGTLQADFPASFPRGFIIVDNTGSASFTGNIGGGGDIFTTKLMPPNHIDVCNGMFTSVANAFEQIQTWIQNNPGQSVPASLSNLIESPHTQAQVDDLAGKTIHYCDNTNSFAGGDSVCQDYLDDFVSFYGSAGGSGNKSENNLMAVEAFKALVLQIRATVGGSGCGQANAPTACTGLKAYSHTQMYQTFPFGTNGSINTLLAQSGGLAAKDQIKRRIFQIKPSASDQDVEDLLNLPVPFGGVSYIYMNNAGNLVLSATAPPWPVPALSGTLPDGNIQNYTSGLFNLNGRIVNVPGEQGYPNPWDCPAIPASGEDRSTWQPSSGYRNLLGIIRFQNCASGGGTWCCPC